MKIMPINNFSKNDTNFKGANIPNGSGSIPAIVTDSVSLAGATTGASVSTGVTTGFATKAALLKLGKFGLIIGGIAAGCYLLKKASDKISEKLEVPEWYKEYDHYASLGENKYDSLDPRLYM